MKTIRSWPLTTSILVRRYIPWSFPNSMWPPFKTWASQIEHYWLSCCWRVQKWQDIKGLLIQDFVLWSTQDEMGDKPSSISIFMCWEGGIWLGLQGDGFSELTGFPPVC